MDKTIPEVFFEVAGQYSNKPALSYKKEGVYFSISYKELSQKVKVFCAALQNLGVNKGDKVAILSENRPEWVIADLAIMTAGAVTVPLHSTFSSQAICHVLRHCQAKILIVSNRDLLNKLLICDEKIQNLEKIIFLGEITEDLKLKLANQIISWEAIFLLNPGDGFEKISLDPNDVCSIIYTSGTTGDPKGVVLSHTNFLSNVEAVTEVIPVNSKDIFLSFLPLSHVLERMGGYYVPITNGATIVYSEGIKHLPENLKEVRPTIMVSVPRVFEKFYDSVWDKVNGSSFLKKKIFKWAIKKRKDTFGCMVADFLVFKKIRQAMGGRLRLTISGGACLNESIARFFSKVGILILEGYGLTETSPVISVNREKEFKFGTVGKVVSCCQVRISEDKEIQIKGSNVFHGYFNNEAEQEKCFTADGWFRTGDLGFIDKDGFLTVIGRSKEMIVTSGGKNVWPEKVENILNNDRFISQSMIIGNKRKFISALIVPDWQELEIFLKEEKLPMQDHESLIKNSAILSLFQKRLDEKINPNLDEYEKVKKIKLLSREFSQKEEELTPTLKLRRGVIEKKHHRLIDLMYE